jgi:hypothetical protein
MVGLFSSGVIGAARVLADDPAHVVVAGTQRRSAETQRFLQSLSVGSEKRRTDKARAYVEKALASHPERNLPPIGTYAVLQKRGKPPLSFSTDPIVKGVEDLILQEFARALRRDVIVSNVYRPPTSSRAHAFRAAVDFAASPQLDEQLADASRASAHLGTNFLVLAERLDGDMQTNFYFYGGKLLKILRGKANSSDQLHADATHTHVQVVQGVPMPSDPRKLLQTPIESRPLAEATSQEALAAAPFHGQAARASGVDFHVGGWLDGHGGRGVRDFPDRGGAHGSGATGGDGRDDLIGEIVVKDPDGKTIDRKDIGGMEITAGENDSDDNGDNGNDDTEGNDGAGSDTAGDHVDVSPGGLL